MVCVVAKLRKPPTEILLLYGSLLKRILGVVHHFLDFNAESFFAL